MVEEREVLFGLRLVVVVDTYQKAVLDDVVVFEEGSISEDLSVAAR